MFRDNRGNEIRERGERVEAHVARDDLHKRCLTQAIVHIDEAVDIERFASERPVRQPVVQQLDAGDQQRDRIAAVRRISLPLSLIVPASPGW